MSSGENVILFHYPVECECGFEDTVEGEKDGADFTWVCPQCQEEQTTDLGWNL